MRDRERKTLFLAFAGAILMFWMAINTFITSNIGVSLILMVVVALSVYHFHFPPVDPSRVTGKHIQNLLTVEKGNRTRNTIFHKAGAGHAPANTKEAIREAIRLGIPAVEIDISFTKDGVGVLIHGPLLEDSTNGTGFVHDHTWEQLQGLNAAAKFPDKDKYPVAWIPTLEESVKLCIDNEIVIFFDCKSDPQRTATLMADLFKKNPDLYHLGIVCSFYPRIIYAVRQMDSKIITALTHRPGILEKLGNGQPRNKELWKQLASPVLDKFLNWAHNYVFWYICGNSFFLLEKDSICGETKEYWEKLGIKLVAWTVNDQLEKNHLIDHLGIPVITDDLVD